MTCLTQDNHVVSRRGFSEAQSAIEQRNIDFKIGAYVLVHHLMELSPNQYFITFRRSNTFW